MHKLKRIVALTLVLTLGFMTPVDATSGKLKGASITRCGGETYGYHGDGHWHYATQHDSGWYPDGGSLGYDNPCAATESYDETYDEPVTYAAAVNDGPSQAEIEEQERLDKEAQEKEEKAKEKKAKEEAEAKQKAEQKEKEKKENVKIASVSHGTNRVSSFVDASSVYIVDFSSLKDNTFTITMENDKASSKFEYEKPLVPFEKNTLKMSLTSEDGTKKESKTIEVFPIGTKQELGSKKASFTVPLKEKRIAFEENQTYTLTTKEIKELQSMSKGHLKIDDFGIENVSYVVSDKGDEKQLIVTHESLVLTFPIIEKHSTTTPLIVGGAALLLGLGVFLGDRLAKSGNKKSKTQ